FCRNEPDEPVLKLLVADEKTGCPRLEAVFVPDPDKCDALPSMVRHAHRLSPSAHKIWRRIAPRIAERQIPHFWLTCREGIYAEISGRIQVNARPDRRSGATPAPLARRCQAGFVPIDRKRCWPQSLIRLRYREHNRNLQALGEN